MATRLGGLPDDAPIITDPRPLPGESKAWEELVHTRPGNFDAAQLHLFQEGIAVRARSRQPLSVTDTLAVAAPLKLLKDELTLPTPGTSRVS
jgi:hypothetical protein